MQVILRTEYGSSARQFPPIISAGFVLHTLETMQSAGVPTSKLSQHDRKRCVQSPLTEAMSIEVIAGLPPHAPLDSAAHGVECVASALSVCGCRRAGQTSLPWPELPPLKIAILHLQWTEKNWIEGESLPLDC